MSGYQLTINELAHMYRTSVHAIHKYIRRTAALEEYVINDGHFVYISTAALPIFDDYFIIPDGWVKADELCQMAGIDKVRLEYRLQSVPKTEIRNYKRKFIGGVYYNPAVVDFVNSTQRTYIHLVKQPPAGQLWFTLDELADLFGVSREVIYGWIEREKIPPEMVRREPLRKLLIHRDAIALNDGKRFTIPSKIDNDVIEWDRLVIDEGYELTPEQHEIRKKLKQQHFDAIK